MVFLLKKGGITLEINLLDIVISVLLDNKKATSKLEKCYDREKSELDAFAKEKHLDITKVDNKLKTVIMKKEASDILTVIGDCFTQVKNNVKNGLRFKDTVNSSIKPTDIVKAFAIYKFFELLLNKWQPFDDYESYLAALAYHDINKTKLKDFEMTFGITMAEDATKRSIMSAFCGSAQLYTYVYELLLHNGMSMEETEKIKLTARDYKDVAYEIAELFEANKQSDIKGEDLLQFDMTDESSDLGKSCTLILIGILVKVFSKLYLQKKQELDNAKPEKEIIFKEDLESKKLLADKQRALNQLQLDYDKQKARLAAVTEELNSMKEYVDIVEKVQEMEEHQDNAENSRFTVPFQKGVILFGGHPNFQHKFAEKYSWVKIIDVEDVRVDWNLVKNASLVLINWRHLSHRQFYKLISVVREYKKEHRYVW